MTVGMRWVVMLTTLTVGTMALAGVCWLLERVLDWIERLVEGDQDAMDVDD